MNNYTNIGACVGYHLLYNPTEEEFKRARAAIKRCLRHFPWLSEIELNIGKTTLIAWGRERDTSTYTTQGGDTLLSCGATRVGYTWQEIEKQLENKGKSFYVPWDGRNSFVRISSTGETWKFWSDWVGSIQVFYAPLIKGGVASTLEPSVVSCAGYGLQDVSKKGLMELLRYGNLLCHDTLFETMHTIPADSVSSFEKGVMKDSSFLLTVYPTEFRWSYSRDRLLSELHELTLSTIGKVLDKRDDWYIPLSGGMDSRLIAAVASEKKLNPITRTYGPAGASDPIYAKQVAQKLGFSWKRIEPGTEFLKKYTEILLNIQGSTMWADGVYVLPSVIKSLAFKRPAVTGYLGETIAGDALEKTCLLEESEKFNREAFRRLWYNDEELKELLGYDPKPYVEEVKQFKFSVSDELPGRFFSKAHLENLVCSHGRYFSYMPTLYDYFIGVETPYMNREYVNFFLSLPRVVLDERSLQKEYLKKYWNDLAKIPGTFHPLWPLEVTEKWLFKAGIAKTVPKKLRVGPLKEFLADPSSREKFCVKKWKWQSLYPLTKESIESLFNPDPVLRVAEQAFRGDKSAYKKLRTIQVIVYSLNQSVSGHTTD